jgi:hypothetical protein
MFKRKKAKETELEPIARLQIGNYIIKEWGRSASPSGKVYNVPCITIEDAALTWRVSVEASHARYMFFQTLLHWAEVSPDGSSEIPHGTKELASTICALTFYMVTEDFMLSSGPDVKFLQAVMKAMKSHADRRQKEADARQSPEERAKADAEALEEMRNPKKAADEL